MIRLAVVVEGPTEEEFVKTVLSERLSMLGVAPDPILVGEGGGNVTVEKLASDMAKASVDHDCVSSFVDFYGFTKRGGAEPTRLERQINDAVGRMITKENRPRQRVFSYVQKYEFEGLLFSDVSAFDKTLTLPEGAIEKLHSIRSDFKTPEDINDSAQTAPSKRIDSVIPRYQKRNDGPLIAKEIGLAKIRAECPRFDRWVTKLEGLGSLGSTRSN